MDELETYPGTNLLKRICYGCDRPIESLDQMWLDYDSNCVVCTLCRFATKTVCDSDEEWRLSLVRVTPDMYEMINELEEG